MCVLKSVYGLQSSEVQLRRLADFAFLLMDLRFAQSIYDTVKKDFQHDKAHKFYAGVQVCTSCCGKNQNNQQTNKNQKKI